MTESRLIRTRRRRARRRRGGLLLAAVVLVLTDAGVAASGIVGSGGRPRAAVAVNAVPAPSTASSATTAVVAPTTSTTAATTLRSGGGATRSSTTGAAPASGGGGPVTASPSSGCGFADCVTLDATAPTGPVVHAGSGLNELSGPAASVAQMQELGITMYRSAPPPSGPGTYNWSDWDAAVAAGAKTTLILSNLWVSASGQRYPPTPWSDWNRYNSWVKETVTAVLASGRRVDYWDVYNEPGWNNYYSPADFQSETSQDLLDQFLYTYQDIKSVDPGAAIIGPSSGYMTFSPIPSSAGMWSVTHEPDITTFLTFCAQHGLRLSAVAWHDNGTPPQIIVQWAARVEAIIRSLPQLGDPPMYLDEYGYTPNQPVPGWDVGYLSAIARGGFAYSVRSCWDSCQPATMDGLLIGGQTTPDWFERLTYAQMQGQWASTTSTSSTLVPLASVQGDQVVGLLGRMAGCGSPASWCQEWAWTAGFGPAPPPERVGVSVVLPWTAPSVNLHLSYEASDPGAGLAAPIPFSPGDVRLSPDGSGRELLTFSIPGFADGDAYNLVVTPA